MNFSFILKYAIQYFAANKSSRNLSYLVVFICLLAILGMCSSRKNDTDVVIDNVQNSANDLRDRINSITPPNTETIQERVENEVQGNQDDSSFFMDD